MLASKYNVEYDMVMSFFTSTLCFYTWIRRYDLIEIIFKYFIYYLTVLYLYTGTLVIHSL